MWSNENLIILALAAFVSLSTLAWAVYGFSTRSEKRRIFLEDIFESAPDGIFLVGPDGAILIANKQAEIMFGHNRGGLTGKRVEDLVPDRLRAAHVGYRGSYTSQPRTRAMGSGLALYGRRKDGSEFPVDIMLSPLGERRPSTTMAIVRDVTERARTEAEKMNTINTVARSVAHDLRNPLTAIASASYMLKSEPEVTEQGRRMLTLIERNISSADKIVTNLLDFSSAVRPQFQEVRIASFLKEILADFPVPATTTIVTHCDDDLRTSNDPALLKRALTNLIANALDSMPSGGTLTIGCKSLNDQIQISIADTGVGMSQDTIARLGTLFFTTKSKGMGVGFAITKKFIEGTGGTLGLTSEQGKGTTVTVNLGREN